MSMDDGTGQRREYRQEGKFLHATLPACEVRVLRMHHTRHDVIVLSVRSPTGQDVELVCLDSKCGFIGDFLGIPRAELNAAIALGIPGSVTQMNNLLMGQGERLMQISAARAADGTWFVFNVATADYRIIKYSEVRAAVKEILGNDVVERKIQSGSYVWERRVSEFACNEEQFNSLVVVESGSNTKKHAARVYVLTRVHSCNNSVRAAEFSVIKHTTNWRERLEKHLRSAAEIAAKTEEVVRLGMESALTVEDGMRYIDNLEFGIQDADKIEHVRELLRRRFEHEFSKRKNKFALSQALSWVGTHDDPALSSERTLLDMQVSAFQVLRT